MKLVTDILREIGTATPIKSKNIDFYTLSEQSDSDWLEDIEALKSEGLSVTGQEWLQYRYRQPYLVRRTQRAATDASWAAWLNAVNSYTNRGGMEKSEVTFSKLPPIPSDGGLVTTYLQWLYPPFTGKSFNKFDVGIAASKAQSAIAEARAFEDMTSRLMPYRSIWPYPNVVESERSVNGFPLIFAFTLDGETLNTAAEYRAYWNQFFHTDRNDSQILALKFAASPNYVSFLNQLNDLLSRTYISSQKLGYALQWVPNANNAYTVRPYPTSAQTPLIAAALRNAIYSSDAPWVKTLASKSFVGSPNYLPTDSSIIYEHARVKAFQTTLQLAVESEIVFRFGKPNAPIAKRKKKWWVKLLKIYLQAIGYLSIAATAFTGGFAAVATMIAASQAAKFAAQKIGGTLGIVVGGIVSAAVGMGSSSIGFIPAASALSPSYSVTNTVLSYSPLPVTINTLIGAGTNAYIQSIIKISPETLTGLGVGAPLEFAAVAGSIVAPKATKYLVGSVVALSQYDKLTSGSWDVFLPAVKSTALAFSPANSQQIRIGYEALKFAPDASDAFTAVAKFLPKIPEYIAQGLIKAPELAVKGVTYAIQNVSQVPQLAVKGFTYVGTEVPKLAVKGVTYVGTEVPQLAVKGVTYVGTEVPQLAVKGATFVMTKSPELVMKGVTYVATEIPQLTVKGTTFVLNKSADILTEGFEESGKAIIKIPELIGKGLGEAANFTTNQINDLAKLLVKAVSHLDEINIPAVSLPNSNFSNLNLPNLNLPNLNLGGLTTTIVPVATVTPTGITTVQQPIPVSTGTSGESIIHLPARPIEVNPLPLLALGAAAAVLLVAAIGRKD